MSDPVLYEVKGKVATITFNLPKKLNALTFNHYLALGKFLEEADRDDDVLITIIQSTGRFFSAGANTTEGELTTAKPEEIFSHEMWLKGFAGRNTWLVDVLHNHTKILVCALNGPVIGLSSGVVGLCDLIYCNDEDKAYLLAPFSNLGLVAEGALSVTLFNRLGWSKSAEALLMSKAIPGRELNRLGFFNKTYTGQGLSTEEFNEAVHKEVLDQVEGLYEPSILANKQLLKANRDQAVSAANSKEAIQGFNRWIEGVPQGRFMQLIQGDIKHKM